MDNREADLGEDPDKGFLFCPLRGIRIHKKTFAYYNGAGYENRVTAQSRNILPPLRGFFEQKIIDNKLKAESQRP